MVKDEADIIEGSTRHMARELDHLIIADNGSTDGTREILDELAREFPLTVVDDPDPAYYQGRKMTRLAAMAGDMGAEWVVPFDADELYSATGARVADALAGVRGNVVCTLPFSHRPTPIDPSGVDPFRSMVWRNPVGDRLVKVVFRWERGAEIRQGNHSVALPSGVRAGDVGLTLRHFPVRSLEQFLCKTINGHAAYRLTNLPESEGDHWRRNGRTFERGGAEALRRVYETEHLVSDPASCGLVRDPAPYRPWKTS